MNNLTLKNKQDRARKMMLLLSLLSITMTFGGLTSAYVVSKGRPDWLIDFTLPVSFIYSTIVLLFSSVTIHLSKIFLSKPNGKSNSFRLLIVTFILGLLFLFFQFNGFNDFVIKSDISSGLSSPSASIKIKLSNFLFS